jgi:putative transposase
MTGYDSSVLLNLYLQIAPAELFRLLQRQSGQIVRNGIYSARLVIWMMMNQRLQAGGTLARSVEQLAQGRFAPLLSRCKRVTEKRIGLGTAGYCQARQNLPKLLVIRSVNELIERLRERMGKPTIEGQPRVYVLDGSSVQLEYDAETVKTYPQGHSHSGRTHRPVIRMVVLHDLDTGLAERPYWGPMYGPEAVSEQALAEQATQALPASSVIIGDRNFGIFSVAFQAHSRGHGVIIRLTAVRARKVAGGAISSAIDQPVVWQSSRWDKQKAGGWPTDARVAGRLIARQVGRGKHKQWLYLFTTMPWDAEQVVACYGRRWRIETDLRSLKQTVRLQQLCVHSADMADKELLVAVMAYNLVRAIMYLAAQQSGGDPRQLSFTYACNIVLDGYPKILAARGVKQRQHELDTIIKLVAKCKLPQRRKQRSFPRAVWGSSHRFPLRKANKTE